MITHFLDHEQKQIESGNDVILKKIIDSLIDDLKNLMT